jgi:hypothetical protein
MHAQGRVVVTHRLAARGAQRTVRLPEQAAALESVVLGAFASDRPGKPACTWEPCGKAGPLRSKEPSNMPSQLGSCGRVREI